MLAWGRNKSWLPKTSFHRTVPLSPKVSARALFPLKTLNFRSLWGGHLPQLLAVFKDPGGSFLPLVPVPAPRTWRGQGLGEQEPWLLPEFLDDLRQDPLQLWASDSPFVSWQEEFLLDLLFSSISFGPLEASRYLNT